MKPSTKTFIALGWAALLIITIYCTMTLLRRTNSKKVNHLESTAEKTFATTDHPKINFASQGEILGVNKSDTIKVVNSKYFDALIHDASIHPRKRRINDLTSNPALDDMQILLNTFLEGSYSPIHTHMDYAETFIILDGALSVFTFDKTLTPSCHVLHALPSKTHSDRAIIIEKNVYHGLTAAPKELGYPGYAIIFDLSGHKYERNKPTKLLADFASSKNNGLDGDPDFYKKIFRYCPNIKNRTAI